MLSLAFLCRISNAEEFGMDEVRLRTAESSARSMLSPRARMTHGGLLSTSALFS